MSDLQPELNKNGSLYEHEFRVDNDKKVPIETVYSPDKVLHRPRYLWCLMLANLRASKQLTWRLMIRDIRARYRQSYLGYLWAFIPPIVTTLLWTVLRSQGIFAIGDTGIPYPIYVLTGIMLWDVFRGGMKSGLDVVNTGRSMLTKLNFPREALVFANAGQVMVDFAVRLVVLAIACVLLKFSPPATVILALVGIVGLLGLGIIIGLLLVTIGALYKDVEKAIGYGISLWFYLTPVVYPPPSESTLAFFLMMNPVTPLLVTTRELMTTGTLTQPLGALTILVCIPLMLAGVWVIYHISMPHIIERMNV